MFIFSLLFYLILAKCTVPRAPKVLGEANDPSNAGSAEYLVRKKKIEETVMIDVGDHGITVWINFGVEFRLILD
ncbi:hypothetical protein U1Q18_004402 [Sarracenia purpurea var. burkii]